MKIEITKGCEVQSWIGRYNGPLNNYPGPLVEIKKGHVCLAEEFDDKLYYHEGRYGFPDLFIPKENCVVIDFMNHKIDCSRFYEETNIHHH